MLAEITCNIGDEIWKMNDEEILERTIKDLYMLKIMYNEKVCFTAVKRLKYAYIIIDLEYNENIRKIKEFMREVGVDVIGRFAEFKYLNMDECVREAIKYLQKFEMSMIKRVNL